ncbi:MAG: hypothetical protein ACXVB9_05165 [Bdellovibrionota bacterium]
MRVLPWFSMMLLFSSPVARAANWEVCLDKGDFSYVTDETILSGNTTTVSKTGCKFVFSVLGGKGEKFEVDVCDPQIHVDHFATLEAAGHRISADVAGCPAPTFGADFDAKAKEFNEYRDVRKRVYGLLDKVRDFYADELTRQNIFSPYDPDHIRNLEGKEDRSEPQEKHDARLTAAREACAQFLLSEYLTKCMSFEGKKDAPKETAAKTDLLKGVHPQTILVPKVSP